MDSLTGKALGLAVILILLSACICGCERRVTEEERRSSGSTANVPLTPEKPSFLPVPRGIRGLSFGMTVDDAKKSLGAEAEFVQAEPESVAGEQTLDEIVPIRPGETSVSADSIVKVPGEAYRVKTTIGSESVQCKLSFRVADRLSEIACEFSAKGNRENHEAVEEALLKSLTIKYGPPQKHPEEARRSDYLVSSDRAKTWVWESQDARLELGSKFSDFAGMVTSEITLVNTSAEHLALMERLKKEANDKIERSRQRREAARQREVQRVKEQAGSFEHDL